MKRWICFGFLVAGQAIAQKPATAPAPPAPPAPIYAPRERWRAEDEEEVYERARNAMDARRWEQALRDFERIAQRGVKKADAALYWKAYVESRAGRREEALQTLEQFKLQHMRSAWANDAKALEVEMRRGSGGALSPDSEQDEDLKLLAMSGLMNSEPKKALPMVARMLAPEHAPKVRERALFVIAHAGLPEGREIVLKVARGGANPDLQRKALEYLGIMGVTSELEKLYPGLTDASLKRALLRGLAASDARDTLLRLTKSEQDPAARRDAVRYLAAAEYDVGQLYAGESDPQVRVEIIRYMSAQDRFDQIAQIARTERETAVRREAVRKLGQFEGARTSEVLGSLYPQESDANLKREIIRSLRRSDSAAVLVRIARQEKDAVLKRELVRALADMKSPEASEFLMEILGQK